MFFPFSISIIFQIICAVHALKTGRSQWLWIILIFPFVGCVIYFIMEVLPDINNPVDAVTSTVQKAVIPNHQIVKLQQELEICDVLANRLALADAYLDRERYADAVQVLEVCLKGPNQNDAEVLRRAAHAYYGLHEYPKAREFLMKIKGASAAFSNQEDHLLLAMIFQQLKDKENALREYETLVKSYTGEEARCRYALLLKELGRTEEADKLFAQTIRNCKISPPFYRREHKQWLNTATKELKGREKK